MKKLQYNYLPADSAATSNSRDIKSRKANDNVKTVAPPDEATVARLNAMAKEYPFCAWGRPRHNTLL